LGNNVFCAERARKTSHIFWHNYLDDREQAEEAAVVEEAYVESEIRELGLSDLGNKKRTCGKFY
jgi:hypothetical protein